MGTFEIAFKATAVLHLVAGYLIFGIASNEEVREWVVYEDRNPLAGDILKYLIYIACWLMIACGIAAFLIPKAAVPLAWAAFIAYLLTGALELIEKRRWPSLSKPKMIAIAPRLGAAMALTYFYAEMHA
jgi:hypothetical protein